jgi:hypothetical protein
MDDVAGPSFVLATKELDFIKTLGVIAKRFKSFLSK